MKKLEDIFNKKKSSCFIIAEASANHGGKLDRALKMIRAAKKAGADAVKFQIYSPDDLTLDCNNSYFRIKHPQWGGQTFYQLYQQAQTPYKWFKKLKKAADDEGIIFFATVFSFQGVDLLETIKVPLYKIASFELIDFPLIEYTAKTKKPLIISTGMADEFEIKKALKAARQAENTALLKCVSAYPADPKQMNLRTIPDMEKKFKVPAGLSDHTLGTAVSVAACALGARIIEKHFTLSRKFKTADSFFSLEPDELKQLVDNIRITEKALGSVHYGLSRDEIKSRKFRRSLFAVENINKGEVFTAQNVRSLRPGQGLPPADLPEILGKTAAKSIKRGTPLRNSHIKNTANGKG